MICRKCGQALSENSNFCKKCGCAINRVMDINISDTQEHDLQKANDIKNKKIFTPVLVLIILIIVLLGIARYDSYFNKCLNEAEWLHSIEEYSEAYDKVCNLIYWGENEVIDKIKLSNSVATWYKLYEREIYSQYEWGTIDYSRVIEYLFMGVRSCLLEEDFAKKDWEKDIIKEFKEKYYLVLNETFEITKSTVDKLLSMELDTREKKIFEICKEIENKRKNPIEFENLSWDSNSLYTIAIGQVHNKSDITVRFVKIKVAFKDKNGNVIDTTSTYAVGSEGLASGESSKWRASVKRDDDINSYYVSVIDFD